MVSKVAWLANFDSVLRLLASRTRKPFLWWLLVGWHHASVSQGRICSDNFTCCHTEIEVADQTIYLTKSQYTDTGPTCPSTDLLTPGTWQGGHWSANFWVTGMTRPGKIQSQVGFEPYIFLWWGWCSASRQRKLSSKSRSWCQTSAISHVVLHW